MDLSNYTNPYYDQAVELAKNGQLRDAAKLYRKAVEDPDCPPELQIEAIVKVINDYCEEGKIDLAEAYLLRLDAYELNNYQLGKKYNQKASIADHKGENDKRNRLVEQAILHCEQFAECKNELASAYMRKSNFAPLLEKRELLLKAIDLVKENDDYPRLASYMSKLGITYTDDYDRGMEWLSKALDLASTKPIRWEVYLARVRSWKAFFHLRFNEYHKAIDLCLQIEQLFQREGNNLPALIRPYNYMYLGGAYEMIGDYYESLVYNNKALIFSEKLGIKASMAMCAGGLSEAYAAIGKTQLSIKYALLSFEFFKQADENWDKNVEYSYLHGTYMTLGTAYLKVDRQKAIYYYEKSIAALGDKAVKAGDPSYISLLRGLTGLNPDQKGIDYAQKALDLRQPGSHRVYFPMGLVYMQMQQHDKAIDALEKALNYLRKQPGTIDIHDPNSILDLSDMKEGLDTLLKLGEAYYRRYEAYSGERDLAQALAVFSLSYQLMALLRRGIDTKSVVFHNDLLSAGYTFYIKAILANRVVDYDQIILVFDACKGSVLHQSIIAKEAQEKYSALPMVIKEKELQDELVEIENKLERLQDGPEKKQQHNLFFDKRMAYKAFVADLEVAHPEYLESKYELSVPSLTDIQAQLKENKKLLNYLIGEQSILILFIDEQEVVLRELAKPEHFEKEVLDCFNAIRLLDQKLFEQRARSLYQLLISPVGDLIYSIFEEDDIYDLTIIPHGVLTKLPFEALFEKRVAGKPDYLLNHFDVSYHYSFSLIDKAYQLQDLEATADFLGVAPVYDSLSRAEIDGLFNGKRSGEEDLIWKPLPYSKNEVESIAGLFKVAGDSSCLYLKEEANKQNLLRNLGDFKYIHMAAHFHQHDIPQRSGLVLSDDFLFVNEAYTLDLNAELVVLSACESGIGELSNSEGLMAISRALLYAGARHIVSTLFQVEDQSASEIMQLFYQEVLQGNSIKRSLNNAKREYTRSHGVLNSSCAAFTLIG